MTASTDTKPVAPEDRTPEQVEADLEFLRQLRAENMARYGRMVGGTDQLLTEIREGR